MTQRVLICLTIMMLPVATFAAETPFDRPGESWSWGYGVEEGGGGSSYLGVDIADVTTERLATLKLKEEHGAEVTMVDQDAPAGKAGLKEHDVILSLNGAGVESAAQLRRMIRETPAGRVVALGISREGQPQTIKVQLANRSKSTSARMISPGDINIQIPPIPSIPDIDVPVSIVIAHSSLRSGLMVENLTPQLGEFFGVKGANGVLVRSVEKGSRSEKAGFHAGDVIVKVNKQLVHDTSDFTRALRATTGNTVAVTVIRDKWEQNLNLTLPDRKDSRSILEESLEVPEVSEEMQVELTRADREIARLRPTIERLQRDRPCRLQHMQQRLQESERKLQKRTEKLRHEAAGDWTEI